MKSGGKYKYDNSCRVSYPTEMYLNVRKWSNKKGISIQEFQRRAVEFYLEHLTGDESMGGVRSDFKHLNDDFKLWTTIK